MLIDRSDGADRKQSSIGVAFPESFDRSSIEEFANAFDCLGVDVDAHLVPDGMEYRAAIEWLMPTIVVVFFAKSYFEGMLQAAGEEHYKALTDAASKLLIRFRLRAPTQMRRVSLAKPPDPYSRAISMVYSGVTLESFKLLFPTHAEEAQIANSISFFVKFAEAHSLGEPTDNWAVLYPEISKGFPGSTRLLVFDSEHGKLIEIDPIPPEVRNR